MNDFDLAIERVVAGLQRKTPLTPEVRKKVAYHETGHALVACYLPNTDPVHKVSIIPTTKGALGYTMQRPNEDHYLVSESELRNRMADLERATETARRMVIEFGMSPELGPVRYAAPSMMYLSGESGVRNDVGDDTSEKIDMEIRRLVNESQERAMNILREHEGVLHEVAKMLQDKEVINHDEIQEVVDRENVKPEE